MRSLSLCGMETFSDSKYNFLGLTTSYLRFKTYFLSLKSGLGLVLSRSKYRNICIHIHTYKSDCNCRLVVCQTF